MITPYNLPYAIAKTQGWLGSLLSCGHCGLCITRITGLPHRPVRQAEHVGVPPAAAWLLLVSNTNCAQLRNASGKVLVIELSIVFATLSSYLTCFSQRLLTYFVLSINLSRRGAEVFGSLRASFQQDSFHFIPLTFSSFSWSSLFLLDPSCIFLLFLLFPFFSLRSLSSLG